MSRFWQLAGCLLGNLPVVPFLAACRLSRWQLAGCLVFGNLPIVSPATCRMRHIVSSHCNLPLQSRLDNDRQAICLCRPEDGLKLSNYCSTVLLLFCLSRAPLLRQTINYVLKLSAAIARDSVPCRSRDAGISKGRLAIWIFFCLEVSNLTARAALWNLPGFCQRCQRIIKDVEV